MSTKSNYTILFSINQGGFQKVAEYRKLRLQQKAKNHDNTVSPAIVNREVILLKSMLKKAAEWYGLSLRTITLDLEIKKWGQSRMLNGNKKVGTVKNAQN